MLGGIIGVCAGFLAVLAARLLANCEFKLPRFNAKDEERPSEKSDRARIVEHCRRCAHHKFDSKRGLICKLTDNYGDYQDTCEHFYHENDYTVKQRAETEKRIAEAEQMGLLTKRAIQSVLFHEGCTILEDEEPRNGRFETIPFEDNDCKFVLAFDLPNVIINCIFSMKMDIRLARAIAAEIAESLMVVKIFVSKSFNNNGVADVRFAIETLVQYTDEFRVQFPQYMDILAEAQLRFGELLKKYGTYDNLRRRDIYNKEYREFPDIVDAVTDGQQHPIELYSEEWLRRDMRWGCAPSMQAEWDAFRILRVDNYGDYKLILYQFPEPKEVPEALYGAVLLDTTTNHADYYTLEYSYNGKWVYGSTSRGKHFNYGEVDSPDLELFVAWIFSSGKKLLHYTDMNRNNNEKAN